jgi:dipeptidyl aminopeptidase/acylaminoacyl peptidase
MKLAAKLGVGSVLALAAGAAPALQPVRDFVKHPTYSGVKISPTGEYLALTVDRGEQDTLLVLRTQDLSVVKLNVLPDKKSVGQFYWTSPERLIFNAEKKQGTYAAPFNTGEWFAVNADGSAPRPLIFYGARDATQRGKSVGIEIFSLLNTLRRDDKNVMMVSTYQATNTGAGTEVALMDTVSGRRKTVTRAPRDDCGIALDAQREPRFAVCYDDEGKEGEYDTFTELYNRGADGKWTLLNRSLDTGKDISIVGTAPDGKIYATQSDRKSPEAFGILDPKDGSFHTLFHDPVSDPAGYITSSDGETIIGVITMAGVPRVTLIDEEHPDALIYQSLAKAFPGQFVNFSSATDDGKQIVVSVYSDSNPGELYLYDKGTGKARFLMQGRDWLDPKRMARIEPFKFQSRDGTTIHGYLTIPNGSDGKNLPLVLNPHGGPMGPRDNWGFNWETQLLASRGYAVMQVNFRGSGGFGKAFEDAAYGAWDTTIMNDLIDGVNWGIAQGKVDKDRICVYGGSFGGYSALMAPVKAPQMFKCAFGYVGMYDAKLQMKLSDTSKTDAGMRYLIRAFGESQAERNEMSPITHAAELKLPIYLAAGARDPRCPPEHTEAMYEALEKSGNKPEGMIVQSGEMHGYYGEDAREKLYTEMLAFFDRHIGAKAKAADSP